MRRSGRRTGTPPALSQLDARYGESFTESIEAEFSPDVATILVSAKGSVIPIFKTRLLRELEESIASREYLVENVEAELESLSHTRTRLDEAIDQVEPLRIPLCEETDLTEDLKRIIKERQRHLSAESVAGTISGHEVCEHLYASESWTCPVLVAVCRFRETVIQ